MTFISYAQNYEDVLLWRALQDVPQGFYIDVGAWHPDIDSVTRAFYDHGWHGVNIEPVPDYHRRLAASRPRDVCLPIVLGATTGSAALHVLPGTGLSTTRPALAQRAALEGLTAETITVPQRPLAQVCAEHAAAAIHFLKIDAEGAESAVLAGADFVQYRPWIVLIEALSPFDLQPSHEDWEPALLAADYRYVWFDGLNRYYVAAEHHARLAPHFKLPPNVFDGFMRVADTEAVRLLATAQAELRHTTSQLAEARARGEAAEQRAASALQRATGAMLQRVEAVAARQREHEARLTAEQRAATLSDLLDAVYASTSWRLMGPVRRALRLLRRRRARPAATVTPEVRPDAAAASRIAEPVPMLALAPTEATAPPSASPGRLLHAVHQFHSGSATHDAVTNALFLTQQLLRAAGYESEVYVQHRDPALADRCRLLEELPTHADYVLILHHSLGHDALAHVMALPARKILVYHNITPPEWLGAHPRVQANAALGRIQLAEMRSDVIAALADSEYNAIELRALGFERVQVCTLLFDIEQLRARAAHVASSRGGEAFTILFVGRIAQSKAQADLVRAYARFRQLYPAASRLVLIGRHADDNDPYLRELVEAIQAPDLVGHVLLTGLVSDAELDAFYAQADLYVSLSHHEGFGVPLVEAMAHGVPILAWPSGAIPYTLGDGAELLDSREPDAVAAHMAALARDPARRSALVAAQRRQFERFALDRHVGVLRGALRAAGAEPEAQPADRTALERHACFTIAGHLNGSYSLAAVNRRLAHVLDEAAPGSVRLEQIEAGVAVSDLSLLPDGQRAEISRLIARPRFESAPHIVISHHYPAHVPATAGDVLLALFFWEESAIPEATVRRLNARFKGMLAPSAFVAKTLVDNGVTIPVRCVGYAPDLTPFGGARTGNDGRTFTFLHVSSCFPRKGIDVLLRAYAAAFHGNDAVRLVIKTFANPHNDVAAQVAALRRQNPDLASIEIIEAELDDAGLAALLAQADAMVLPTRGEGFNLPAAEAMAARLPLIVTGFGGHRDFCDATTARLVDFTFARSTSHLASGLSVWAEPDADDLTAALRQAVSDRPSGDARAARAAEALRARFAAERWARQVRATALDLLLLPPAPPMRLAIISTWGVRCGIAEYTRQLVDALPDTDQLGALTVLADDRIDAGAAHPKAAVRAAWRLHEPDGLLTAVAAADPHAVLIQHQPGLLTWRQLANLLSAPAMTRRVVCVTLHNTRHLATLDGADRAATLAALATAARVIVHTVADLNLLLTYGVVDNVVLMPHGTPPLAPARPARDLPAEAAPLIGCTGFFLPDKGIPHLIEAAAGLRRQWPRLRLRLVNAVYEGPESAAEIARAREIAARCGLQDAIDWQTGFLPPERMQQLLGECDLLALPYQRSLEASSAALRSALAAGVPVITTPLPLFDEAGGAVLRAAGVDSGAIEAAIAEALHNPAARAAATEAGRTWASETTWPRIAARMLGLLLGLRASDADLKRWRTGGQQRPA